MNERIKELAEQADNYAEQTVHYYNGQFEGLTWEGKLKQARDTKFAELLLEECCQICIDKWVEKTSEDARDCYVAIQEHFKIGPKYEREN